MIPGYEFYDKERKLHQFIQYNRYFAQKKYYFLEFSKQKKDKGFKIGLVVYVYVLNSISMDFEFKFFFLLVLL